MADIKVKQAAKKVAKMRHNLGKGRPKPKETSGEVKRIEGDVAYVRFDGSEIDTPVNISHACEVGERIRVKVGDDRHAWTMGNITSPPTDNKVANIARRVADRASDTAVQAEERAIEAEHNSESAIASAESAVGYSIEARRIAGNTNQYFWHKEQADPTIEDDETGAHITEVPQEEWEDPNSENYHSGGNLFARSNGIAIRNGLHELATFDGEKVQIGSDSSTEDVAILSDDGLYLYSSTDGAEGTDYFYITPQGKHTKFGHTYSPFLGTYYRSFVDCSSDKTNGKIRVSLNVQPSKGVTRSFYVASDGCFTDMNLTIKNHNQPIGYTEDGSVIADLSNTTALTRLADLTLLSKGTWVITVSVRFPANATGSRAIEIYDGDKEASASYTAVSNLANTVTALSSTAVINADFDVDLNIRARQNSGNKMSVTTYWQAVRIA